MEEDNKTVKLGEQKQPKQKLTYEELENVAMQLSEANRRLQNDIANTKAYLNRFSILIEVAKLINDSKKYEFTEEFCYKVLNEIEDALYHVDEKEKEEKDVKAN